ncbi:MAG TPA: GYD domain-containing protein [Acetobacteraceae bacterium]|nr:GYD domain-containing protein [Acetobacteraceae bacterium]
MTKFLLNGSYAAAGMKGVQKNKGAAGEKEVAYACKALGGKLDAIYFPLGEGDVFAIVDMPGTSDVANLCLAVGASGMKTSALPLLTVAEMDKLLTENVKYQPPGG